MTRYLGQEGFGYYSTIVAYLLFWGILVDFGLTLANVQMISDPKYDFHKVINNIMSFRFFLSLGFLILAPILIWAFPYPAVIKWGVLLTVMAYVCTTFIQTMTGIFQQQLQMFKVVVAEVSGKVAMIALIIIFVLMHKSIYWILASISVEGIVALLILFILSRGIVRWQWEVDWTMWKEIFKRTWPIALSISFNLIYLKMDTIILSLTRSANEVGLYGATYRIVDILTMLPAVFMGIVLPIMTKYYAENNFKDLSATIQRAFDALMIFAVPIVVGAMLVGRPLMAFIGGNGFIVSGDILKVLIIASGAIFATSLFGYAVVGLGQQKKMMWGYLTTAIITFIGYLIFIPKFGYWGAAWMTVFSEVLVMAWSAIIVYKTIKFLPSMKSFLRVIPATIVMALVITLVGSWSVVWVILVAVVAYFLVLYLVGGIKRQFVLDLIKINRQE